jgi:cell wall-associated NlpC family hydrolase
VSARVVAAARAAVGARFRLHGRDPATGLDCVGLAAWALRAGGFAGKVPDGYALRGGDAGRIAALIEAKGLVRQAAARAGDVLLCRSGRGSFIWRFLSGTASFMPTRCCAGWSSGRGRRPGQ